MCSLGFEGFFAVRCEEPTLKCRVPSNLQAIVSVSEVLVSSGPVPQRYSPMTLLLYSYPSTSLFCKSCRLDYCAGGGGFVILEGGSGGVGVTLEGGAAEGSIGFAVAAGA